MPTEPVPGIETLRDVVEWADWQREDHWLPEGGQNPTLTQIVQLHSLCLFWDVETPEDLANHGDPRARWAWKIWHEARGNTIEFSREINRKADMILNYGDRREAPMTVNTLKARERVTPIVDFVDASLKGLKGKDRG